MAGAWGDLATSGQQPAMEDSRWLIEHLLDAETTDRVIPSIRYQMHAAICSQNSMSERAW